MIESFAYIGDETVGDKVCRRLEAAGFTRVGDVAQADIAFTFLPYASALEDAYFEDEGLVKRAAEGTLLVDLSPSTPAFARELAAVATVNELRFVEAPIAARDPFVAEPFGSPESLVCYASGESEDVEAARDALEAIAEVVDAGPAGSGQLAKARHTVLQASQVVSMVECVELARSTFRASSSTDGPSNCGLLAGMGPQAAGAADAEFRVSAADEGGYAAGVPVKMLLADVVAAMSAADDVELIIPHLEAAMHLLQLMAVIGGADLGAAALALIYREESEGAAYGLDWMRAEDMFAGHFHDGSGLDEEMDDLDDFDDGDEFDNLNFLGSFGYSPN